jgi:nucleoside-diphosphate-sugar epimerase/predicted dehydrogenase
MRVGIVGSGLISLVHAPHILKQPGAVIVGVADIDLFRAKALTTKLKTGQYYDDASTMLLEQKPDIVHVLTSPHSHAELSIAAMNRGCHVLVEKPMALCLDDAKRMAEVARQNRVHLCVNRNFAVQDGVRRAVELAVRGEIGELLAVEARYVYDARRNPDLLEEDAQYSHWSYQLKGGPIQDHLPHVANMVMEFIPEIQEIFWLGSNRGTLPEGWDDEIRVLIKSNGLTGYLSVSLNEMPDSICLTVRGTRGTLEANLFNGVLTVQKAYGLPRPIARGLSGFQLSLQNLAGCFRNVYSLAMGKMDKSNGVGEVIADFYQSVRNGSDTSSALDNSLRTIDLMDRIWPTPAKKVRTPRLLANSPGRREGSVTALVTGASGFIGVHLVRRLLSENIKVRAVVRPNSVHAGRLERLNVEIARGDLSDSRFLLEATQGVDLVYHAGATLNNDWEENYQSNIKGTEYMIHAALACQVKRFVHISTLAVYEVASAAKESIIREDSPYQKNPKLMGPYAYSKIEAEKLVFEACRSRGLKATIVRPGIVIGPLGQVFFPHLGYRYQQKCFFVIGDGKTLLPITCIENTVDGIYRASIDEKAIGQAYNLVDGNEITAREYVERFIQATGIQARIVSLPFILSYLATAGYELAVNLNLFRKGLTSRAQLKGKQTTVRFDNQKARIELGWVPRVSLDEGLNGLFTWHLARTSRSSKAVVLGPVMTIFGTFSLHECMAPVLEAFGTLIESQTCRVLWNCLPFVG